MMLHAFHQAGYEEPTIFWSEGETMAAFRKGVAVNYLPPLTNMQGVHSWRTVERFELFGATEHKQCQMVVYNTSQPSSGKRPFPANMRVELCKAVIRDAVRLHAEDPARCGWVFAGDAKCSIGAWILALQMVPRWRLTFDQPSYLYGINRKPGDLMVATGVKGGGMDFLPNTCEVPAREQLHDCMILEWCYKAHAT